MLVEDGDEPFIMDATIVVARGEGKLFSVGKGIECYHGEILH